MSKPLIFLDIDGVVRPNTKPNNYKLNKQNLDLINRVCAAADAEIVISSNWRLIYPIAFFNQHFAGRVIGVTPDFGDKPWLDFTRWQEIKAYMQAHSGKAFCVLDDQSDLFPQSLSQLVVCNGNTGFTEKNYEQVLLRLKAKQ